MRVKISEAKAKSKKPDMRQLWLKRSYGAFKDVFPPDAAEQVLAERRKWDASRTEKYDRE